MANLTKPEIQDRVLTHLRENGAVLPNDLDLTTPIKQLQLDSWDVINLVFMIEEEFGIDIPQGSEFAFENLNDVVEAIFTRINAKSTA